MSEESASITTEQATETTATDTTTAVSIAGADGVFVKDWHTKAPDGYEELRDDKSLATIKSVWDIGKSYRHVRKQVPLDKMARPNDTWGDSDWDEFHKAGGRPDTKEDYNIKRHEEMPEDAMTKEDIDSFHDLLFRHGASKKLSDAIVEWNNEHFLHIKKQIEQAEEDQTNQVSDGLRKEWGLAYDQNVHRGEVAISKDKDVESDPAYKARLLEKVNKDPDLIRFASNMGYKFVEHKIVEDPGIPTPVDIQTQITEIMADPRYSHIDLEVRQPLIDKVLMLRRKLNESK